MTSGSEEPAGRGPPWRSLAVLLAGMSVVAWVVLLAVSSAFAEPRPWLEVGLVVGATIGVGTFALQLRMLRPARRLAVVVGDMSRGRVDASALEGVASLGGHEAEVARQVMKITADHARSIALLRGERDLFERILDGMGEGVLVLDADERIVLANQALRTMARLHDDIRGVPLLEGIRSAALKEALDTARQGELVVREIELGRPIPRKLLARVSRLGEKSPRSI